MKNCLMLLLFITISSQVFSQEKQFGIQIAPSYSFLYQNNDFDFVPTHEKTKIIGLNVGVFYHLNWEKWSLLNSFDFQEKLYIQNALESFTDINGNRIGVVDRLQSNISGIVNVIPVKTTLNGTYFGLGITANLLLLSAQRTSGVSILGRDIEPQWIRNYRHRPITLSVPVILGHQWEYSNIYLKFQFDLTNRLPKESLFTEKENMIQLGYGVVINRD